MGPLLTFPPNPRIRPGCRFVAGPTVGPGEGKGPMVAFEIEQLQAIEILDSRGRPTLQVSLALARGPVAVAGVPSGASTGSREAVELRDGDLARFGGAGVRQAVAGVNGELAGLLAGRAWGDLGEVDQAMRELDRTPNKARLGANAIIGVSMALARALAVADGHSTGLGDEGGFAPNLAEPEEVLQLIVAAISDAGYLAGRAGVAIALDPAASEFHSEDGSYLVNGSRLSSAEMIVRYQEIVERFPVWSIEDGLGEADSEGWKALTAALGEKVQLVGDDNFCTNPALIRSAIDDGIANAALIKLNQIGTVSETLEAMRVCHQAGYRQMVSHRSGETPDTFIADLAVATGCGQIKTGAPARGERVAKYNRLIQIAGERPGLDYGLAGR